MGRREKEREKREGHRARRDRAAGVAAAAAESRFHAARMLDDGRMGVRVVLVGREGPPSEGKSGPADVTVQRQHISVIWHMHKPLRQAFGVE